jgi:23S rRNA (uracil1939-C5)-methyltransferase
MGKKIRTLWGEDTIEDCLHVMKVKEGCFEPTSQAVRFRISPLSFYQVNPKQTEKLYSLVLHYCGLTGKETVFDLYCGVGTISLFLAHGAKEVYGVESVPEAIEDARENARLNGITNVLFETGEDGGSTAGLLRTPPRGRQKSQSGCNRRGSAAEGLR